MDQEQQQEFISWLGDKLGAQDDKDLQKKLHELGDDGVKQAYDKFLSEKKASYNKEGGKLDYIKCLNAFKKGGKMEMEKCGCGGKVSMDKMGARIEATTKEKNPGAKDWMSLGKKGVKKGNGSQTDTKSNSKQKKDWMDKGNTKKEHTAVTKVPKNQMGGQLGAPQAMTPEQVENQKLDNKVNEMAEKKALRANPDQDAQPMTALDKLREALKPKANKLRPKPMMKVFSANGEVFGDVAKHAKGGKAKPEWLMKAEKKAESKDKSKPAKKDWLKK